MSPHYIFVTGGTGYLGRPLTARLAARGHAVRALCRPASASRLPPGVCAVLGDALRSSTFAAAVPPADTFVHLVGTPHPNPTKAREFQEVDLASLAAAVEAATSAGIRHFVYVSVAHPAPVMRAFIAARVAAEERIRASGLDATILRPWYVLGPGHRWPYLLLPVYALLSRLPATRDGARRLGLVTRDQMVGALLRAVENPTRGPADRPGGGDPPLAAPGPEPRHRFHLRGPRPSIGGSFTEDTPAPLNLSGTGTLGREWSPTGPIDGDLESDWRAGARSFGAPTP
jgi:uncharacterized protein YbjT (DUF2867 family)